MNTISSYDMKNSEATLKKEGKSKHFNCLDYIIYPVSPCGYCDQRGPEIIETALYNTFSSSQLSQDVVNEQNTNFYHIHRFPTLWIVV